jgi:hypothetical protein
MSKAIDIIKQKITNIVDDLINNASDNENDENMSYFSLLDINGYELSLSAYWNKEDSKLGKILNVHFEFIVDDEIENSFWLSFHSREWLMCTILDEYINYRKKEYY